MAEPTVSMHAGQQPSVLGRSVWFVTLYCLAIIALFYDTAWSIVAIWNRSDTYMHGYLIVPIALWLVWLRRDVIAGLSPRPVLRVQSLILLIGLTWLLARLIDVLVVQQFALVGLLIVGIWSLVGHSIARLLAFPLGFLLLAVPVGDDLVPIMMEFTATSTVALIKLTGIPVYREGMYFSLPSGNWSVVYACSGVRYLLASITLGVLYAYLTYRSLTRRALFVLASIVVPVLANSARAYIIVMLGHLSDMKIATGVDHLLYGWVFFGAVMFLLFWVGSIWREDTVTDQGAQQQPPADVQPDGQSVSPWLALSTALVMAGSWPLLFAVQSSVAPTVVENYLAAPRPGTGWHSVADTRWDWRPLSRNPDREMMQSYSVGDQEVALYVSQYLQQEQGTELVSGINLFVAPDDGWRVLSRGPERINLGSDSVSIDQVLLGSGDKQLFVWSWYRIGSFYTANRYTAKIYELIEQLTFSDRGSAHIVVATDTMHKEGGPKVLQKFVTQHLTAIEEALDSRLTESSP